MDGPSDRLEQLVESCVERAVGSALGELRAFIDRRIAELSTEIHATVQLVDFSEANLSGQLAQIHGQIARMVAVPAAATRNSGVELEAVVEETEKAANRIMEAAEAISTWLAGDQSRDGAAAIADKVNAIFEACSFQDLTGQRVRRAIEHLQRVDALLSDMMGDAAEDPPAPAPVAAPDLAQDEIDRLLG
jgi:chemotaxis protein CheZ